MLRSLATRPAWRSFIAAERQTVFARFRSTTRQNPTPSPIAPTAKQPLRERHPAWTILRRAVAVYLVLHILFQFVIEFSFPYGISMLPTINSAGDCVFISKWYRRGRGIQVGDIVSYMNPVKEREGAVKRVIGLPGDFVLTGTPGHGQGKMIQVGKACYGTLDC